MSTLRIRAAHIPHLPLPSFARIASTIALVFDAFAEAQNRARAAHRRYPFAEW